jgi:hypothetical protein
MSGIRVHNEKTRQQLTGCLHVPLSKLGDDVVILLAPLYMIGLMHAKDMQRNNACSMPEKKKKDSVLRAIPLARHHSVSSHIPPVRTVQPFQPPS